MAIIAVDMDEVVADALSEHLKRYNKLFGTSLDKAALMGRKIGHVIPFEHRKACYDIVHHHDFFSDLEVMPGAQDVLQQLSRHHDIFIATAAMEVPASFSAKYEWLLKHFPFISPMNFVFCGDKGIIAADYLIDDNPRHFKRFRGEGILFDAPHNQHVPGYRRVHNWYEVRDVFAAVSA